VKPAGSTTTILKKNIVDYGGAMTNQYDIPWDWDKRWRLHGAAHRHHAGRQGAENSAHSGWNNDWVDYIYEMNNIPSHAQER
jgi:7,8-dihydropterin-6-yl-methyl-4-(beta-D-ribofuranosyl)aminobenzene 5'-phosphate synthase